jgi:hypothetical protein
MFEHCVLSIIYYTYDFDNANIVINDTTCCLKGDLKFRSWNICLLIYMCVRM